MADPIKSLDELEDGDIIELEIAENAIKSPWEMWMADFLRRTQIGIKDRKPVKSYLFHQLYDPKAGETKYDSNEKNEKENEKSSGKKIYQVEITKSRLPEVPGTHFSEGSKDVVIRKLDKEKYRGWEKIGR